jgi:anti-sigma factor RsiW
MHCSSCEPLLDRYVEGTLAPRRMIEIRRHVESCESCRGLLDELNVVDALLFTARSPELPVNFTFAVMAEVGAMPPPRRIHHPFWSFVAIYPAAAWVATIIAIAVTGANPARLLASAGAVLAQLGNAAGSFDATLAHNLSHSMPLLAAFGFGVLAIDAALAAAVAAIYFGVRPRVAAILGRAPGGLVQ